MDLNFVPIERLEKVNDNTYILGLACMLGHAERESCHLSFKDENSGLESTWDVTAIINFFKSTLLISAVCLREDDKDTSYRFTLTIEKCGCEAITRSIEIVGNEGGTISVNCNNLSEIKDIHIKIESLSNKSPECNMTHDFAKILASEESSDVTLVTGDGTEFKAHTFELSARSVAEVMKEMLNYLYTDRKIPNQMAAPLYTAANKYALLHLQDMCEQALIETMDVASVADTLRLADLHGNERLKTKAITFIARNIKTVTDTESWKRLRQTDHQLCMDVLEEVAKQHF